MKYNETEFKNLVAKLYNSEIELVLEQICMI